MYCPECGAESKTGVQFCRACGTNLKTLDKPSLSSRPWISFPKRKTPAEKREDHISKGVVSLFSGIGMTIFLYFLSAALVLKLPPEVLARIPFEVEPVAKMIWLFGLLPATSGLGHIIAGLLIRPKEQQYLEPISEAPEFSVTDRTTHLLEPQKSTKSS